MEADLKADCVEDEDKGNCLCFGWEEIVNAEI